MSDRPYFLPILGAGPGRSARRLAGGWVSFDQIDVLRRGHLTERLPVDAALALWPQAAGIVENLTVPRADVVGVDLRQPRIMGIVNVTPDSFSDGGAHGDTERAVAHGLALADAGADILDIGGESTRPGAEPISEAEEMDRVLPVIEALSVQLPTPISIDTRNGAVAGAALVAGARMVNDVSALTHDDTMPMAASRAETICLMHALGDPRTMQDDPQYDDVLLDIYDYLEGRIAAAEDAGIKRNQVIVDPGIGFGKTLEHNLHLIRGAALLHGLGAGILLGVSRKGFIGKLSRQPVAAKRVPGSIAAGLVCIAQGAQFLRVHDVAEMVEALRVWQALSEVVG